MCPLPSLFIKPVFFQSWKRIVQRLRFFPNPSKNDQHLAHIRALHPPVFRKETLHRLDHTRQVNKNSSVMSSLHTDASPTTIGAQEAYSNIHSTLFVMSPVTVGTSFPYKITIFTRLHAENASFRYGGISFTIIRLTIVTYTSGALRWFPFSLQVDNGIHRRAARFQFELLKCWPLA